MRRVLLAAAIGLAFCGRSAAQQPGAVALDPAVIAAMPVVRLPVAFDTDHGRQSATYAGPLLWTVLVQEKAVDPAAGRSQVQQRILVTGSDGYAAVIAMGEISPLFEGKQVILAERMNDAPLGAGHLRILVPGDAHGGRSVRDVVGIRVLAD